MQNTITFMRWIITHLPVKKYELEPLMTKVKSPWLQSNITVKLLLSFYLRLAGKANPSSSPRPISFVTAHRFSTAAANSSPPFNGIHHLSGFALSSSDARLFLRDQRLTSVHSKPQYNQHLHPENFKTLGLDSDHCPWVHLTLLWGYKLEID